MHLSILTEVEQKISYLKSFVTEKRVERFEEILKNRTRHFTVVLEDLYQKHNQSAIVRSCDIFGIQDLYIIENKYISYMSNQVAKGSQKWLDFYNYDGLGHNTQNCIDDLRKKGYQIIATTPHNNSCFIDNFDITKKSAFVFGVEKAGVSDLVMNQADGFVKIPMYGFTESLNVSVAAAIILQNVTEKVRKLQVKWQLSEIEKNKIRLKWLQKSIKNIDLIMERYLNSK